MTSCFVARISNPGERFGKPFYEVDVPSPLCLKTYLGTLKTYPTHLYVLLIVSSRLSSTLVKVVHAASSSNASGCGDVARPTLNSFSAAERS